MSKHSNRKCRARSGKRGGTQWHKSAKTRLHHGAVCEGGECPRRVAETGSTHGNDSFPGGNPRPHAEDPQAVGGATPERLLPGTGSDWLPQSRGGPCRQGRHLRSLSEKEGSGCWLSQRKVTVHGAVGPRGRAGSCTVRLPSPPFPEGQPSSALPAPPPLLAPHPEAEALSVGGAAQRELQDPEEAPSPASAMEPTALSLTEEDLTEVKKDVSSTALPRRPAGWGRAGASCSPAGEESGNPESESEEEPASRRDGQDHREPCIRGALVEVIPWRPVNLRFKSLEAGLGILKPSLERLFAVYFLPTTHLSPVDFTLMRFEGPTRFTGSTAQVHLWVRCLRLLGSKDWTR